MRGREVRGEKREGVEVQEREKAGVEGEEREVQERKRAGWRERRGNKREGGYDKHQKRWREEGNDKGREAHTYIFLRQAELTVHGHSIENLNTEYVYTTYVACITKYRAVWICT